MLFILYFPMYYIIIHNVTTFITCNILGIMFIIYRYIVYYIYIIVFY